MARAILLVAALMTLTAVAQAALFLHGGGATSPADCLQSSPGNCLQSSPGNSLQSSS